MLASSILSTTHQCWENESLIWGTGQPIWGPIQRRFGMYFIPQVYFLRKSTKFHNMRADFQRINTSHSYLTVLLIYNKFPEIDWSLTPWSLKFFSSISPQSLPNRSLVCWSCAVEIIPCLRGFKLEPSFKDTLFCSRYLFSEWTFKNISHWRSTRMTFQPQPTKLSASSADSRYTSSFTYNLTTEKRDFCDFDKQWSTAK